MRVFYGFDNLARFVRPVVTVGSYDGVHAGHRELLGLIVKMAHDAEGESVVVTFSPHPRTVLNNGTDSIHLLNSLKEKVFLLEQVGIDNLIVAPFTREFSQVSSYDFVHDFLVGKIGVQTLVVGYNHHFGHNKEGNFDYLDHLQSKFGFKIHEVSPHTIDRNKVSSTAVRTLIAGGEMSAAAKFLAHPYLIIAHRDSSGAILSDESNKLLPPAGHYKVTTDLDSPSIHSLIIGSNGTLTIENCPDTNGKDFMIIFA